MEITKQKKHMKFILLLIGAVTLLTSSGCIFPGSRGGGEYRGGDEYRDRGSRDRGEFRGHEEHHLEPAVDVRIHPD
jgi:hypothetical protein